MFKCSVPDCLSHRNTSTLVSLHKYYIAFSFNFLLNYWYVKLSSRFPCKIKDPLRHGEWSKFCSPTYISNTRSRLCDLHFSFSQFKFHQVVGSKTRNVLKTTAVPDVALYVVADTGTDNVSGTVTATAIDTAKNFVTKEVMCYLKIVNLKSEVSTKNNIFRFQSIPMKYPFNPIAASVFQMQKFIILFRPSSLHLQFGKTHRFLTSRKRL